MESFFSLLQKNVLNRRRWQTRDELRATIGFWIESLLDLHLAETSARMSLRGSTV